MDRAAKAAEIPDLYAAVARGGSEDAVVGLAGLEADLLERRGVVLEHSDGSLGDHVDDSPCLISRRGSESIIIIREGYVDDRVRVGLERKVDITERM